MTSQVTTHADELKELRDAVRGICRDAGTAPARSAPDDPVRAELWDVLGRQVGIAGLGLPEEHDGLGGVAEIAVVAEELGRVLLPVPFFGSTVLAGQVLVGCGAAAGPALARVVEGDTAALAALGPAGTWEPSAISVQALPLRDTWSLSGTVDHVLDGVGAARHVVVAQTPTGPDLFLAEGDGREAAALPTLDLSRPQARLVLRDAPALRLTVGGTAGEVLAPALDVAALALAAEQLGGAQACLELTVDYVAQRRQFGRAIGSFQAVKHVLADLLVLVETSRSAVVEAVEAPTAADRAVAASVAQAWCSDAFRSVTAETVQLHGGIGFTWEHDAHLYFRRARADAALLGSASHHRERVAALLNW